MTVNVVLPEYEEFTREAYLKCKGNYSGVSGVYVLLGNYEKVLYVGKSIDIRSRLDKHFSGYRDSERFYKQIRAVRIYRCSNQFYVDVYETYLINELRPEFNRDKMFFKEYVVEMSDKLQEIELRIRELEEERDAISREISEEEDDFHDEDSLRYVHSECEIERRRLDREIAELVCGARRLRRRVSSSGGRRLA